MGKWSEFPGIRPLRCCLIVDAPIGVPLSGVVTPLGKIEDGSGGPMVLVNNSVDAWKMISKLLDLSFRLLIFTNKSCEIGGDDYRSFRGKERMFSQLILERIMLQRLRTTSFEGVESLKNRHNWQSNEAIEYLSSAYPEDDNSLCVVCIDREANMMATSCGHMVICDQCHQRVGDKSSCVICRTRGGYLLVGRYNNN